MTKEQLKENLRQADKNYEAAKYALYKECALSNNPHKIGDTITDHMKTLVIEKIKVHVSFGEPECVYEGTVLTADGKPAKNQDQCIYQGNII